MALFSEIGNPTASQVPLETGGLTPVEQEQTVENEAEIATSQMGHPVETRNTQEAHIAERLTARMAAELNETLGEEMVGPDGRLLLSAFASDFGEARVSRDTDIARSIQLDRAGLNNPLKRQLEIARLGLDSKHMAPNEIADALIAEHTRQESSRNGNLAEVAASVLLHRGLKEKFTVVRATRPDDNNGIDTIVVNRETGEVICAFDEVVGEEYDDRPQKKRERQRQATEEGGSSLTYGFTFKDGQVVKKSFEHVPIFRLCLGRMEVNAALLECDQTDGIGPQSREILSHLFHSLGRQTNDYLRNDKIPSIMRHRLEQYRTGSFREMQSILFDSPPVKMAA